MAEKTKKHLAELFEMWNQEHLDNIALNEKIVELKKEVAFLKKQIYENRIHKRGRNKKKL